MALRHFTCEYRSGHYRFYGHRDVSVGILVLSAIVERGRLTDAETKWAILGLTAQSAISWADRTGAKKGKVGLNGPAQEVYRMDEPWAAD